MKFWSGLSPTTLVTSNDDETSSQRLSSHYSMLYPVFKTRHSPSQVHKLTRDCETEARKVSDSDRYSAWCFLNRSRRAIFRTITHVTAASSFLPLAWHRFWSSCELTNVAIHILRIGRQRRCLQCTTFLGKYLDKVLGRNTRFPKNIAPA